MGQRRPDPHTLNRLATPAVGFVLQARSVLVEAFDDATDESLCIAVRNVTNHITDVHDLTLIVEHAEPVIVAEKQQLHSTIVAWCAGAWKTWCSAGRGPGWPGAAGRRRRRPRPESARAGSSS